MCFNTHFFHSVVLIYPNTSNMPIFPIETKSFNFEKTTVLFSCFCLSSTSVHTSVVITLVAQDKDHWFMLCLVTVSLSLSSGLSHNNSVFTSNWSKMFRITETTKLGFFPDGGNFLFNSYQSSVNLVLLGELYWSHLVQYIQRTVWAHGGYLVVVRQQLSPSYFMCQQLECESTSHYSIHSFSCRKIVTAHLN